MANERIVLRKSSGAGVIVKTRKEADAFLKDNPDYTEDGAKAKAVAPVENKAVKPVDNKARG